MSDDVRPQPVTHDVAILGVHLSTALLATILAKRGVDVVLVDAEPDRRLPAGETTVPYTAELCFLLGRRFDIPEIARLGMFDWLDEDVRRTSGRKQNLGFLFHRPNTVHDPKEAVQFTVPSEHAEWHIHRPRVESYLTELAVAFGGTTVEGRPVARDVVMGSDRVTVTLADGSQVHARFVVDGSGDETLVQKATATTEALPLEHRTRLLTAQLTGVERWDRIVPLSSYDDKRCGPWSEGTLTHAIDGGWIELATFPGDGGEPVTSVKVSLDPDRHPDPGTDPAEEFAALVAPYPELSVQFSRAEPVTEWQRHDDWPRVLAAPSGNRYLLFDRSVGRHDFFFSRDLTFGLETVHATAAGLLRMAAQGRWDGDGLADVGAFQRDLLVYQDRWMAAVRTAGTSFALYNAVLRAYLLWSILSALALKRARLDGEAAGDWSVAERFTAGAFWFPNVTGLEGLLEGILGDVKSVRRGRMPAGKAATSVFRRMRRAKVVPPLYRFWDPDARYYRFSFLRRMRMLTWVATTAPKEYRRLLTKDNITALARPEDA